MVRASPAAATVLIGMLVVACQNAREISYVGDGSAGAGAGQRDGGAQPSGTFFKADAYSGDGPRVVIGAPSPGDDAACAARSIQADRVPLDLYLMMDSSGSMLDKTASGMTKWDAVRTAMSRFVADPQSAGIGVGLQYFPLLRPGVPEGCTADAMCGMSGPCDRLKVCSNVNKSCAADADCGKGGTCVLLGQCAQTAGFCAPAGPMYVCQGGTRQNVCQEIPGYCHQRDLCDTASYAKPAVPVAALPGAAAAIQQSLTMHQPDGLTPTAAALQGALDQARTLAMANNGHRVAVVLATDGFPDECAPTDVNGVANLARTAAMGKPGVPTFVIGVFSTDPQEQMMASMNLNAIAQAGGTTRAFVINTGQNVAQEFANALNEIRTTALACEYKIPPTMMGGQADYGKVNVIFTSGAGQATTIGYAKDKASCNPTAGGWYYDVDPATGMPTTIIACDATCTKLKADAKGRVDIAVGCKTVLIE